MTGTHDDPRAPEHPHGSDNSAGEDNADAADNSAGEDNADAADNAHGVDNSAGEDNADAEDNPNGAENSAGEDNADAEDNPNGAETVQAAAERPAVLDAEETPSIRSGLVELGVPEAEIDTAERSGTLGYLALATLAMPDTPTYDLVEVAARSGLGEAQIAHIWRSLGFPEPDRDDRIFTEVDVEVLRSVASLIDAGMIENDLAVQMSRVIGSSLARVAGAMVDALGADQDDQSTRGTDDDFALAASTLLPTMPRVMDYVWRRHLQAAARRRVDQQTAADPHRFRTTVGFADLVGFTELSQQIPDHDLAAVVDRFESVAYEVITTHGGRVVKMIGDEVMFVVDDVVAAAEIALGLADAFREDAELSDVRVGLAHGDALEREADYFGPVVNRASRIVNIAFPGTVVVSDELHDLLAGDPAFAWKSIKQRRLKDIGKVALWSLRRPRYKDEDSRRDAARRRHTERREHQVERLSTERRGR